MTDTDPTATSSKAATPIQGPRPSVLFWIGAAVFAIATLQAATEVGYLFGFIVGASVSPIAVSVAPLVFGLLGAIGIAGGALSKPDEWSSKRLALLSVTAIGVALFCYNCQVGIDTGIDRRMGPFPSMASLVNNWESLDVDTRALAYDLRSRMQRGGARRPEFTNFAQEVLSPILNCPTLSADEKRARLQQIFDAWAAAVAN